MTVRREYLREAEALAPELTLLRQRLHRFPELGNREAKTAALLEEELHALGIETRRLTDTAVVGCLQGAEKGPTVAFRADMDALPLTESTGVPYASINPGVTHACGHDVHMTALLGAARLLEARRDQLHGSVRFLFEPDEEGSGGAQRMIDAGALEGVGAVFGCHVSPELPSGVVGVRYGKFYAASDMFTVTVTGLSAHGATPEKGRDALYAAARMVEKLHELPKRIPDRCVVTVGTLSAGTAGNILAGSAVFSGILRSLGPENRCELKRLLQETVASEAADCGVEAVVELRESYGGVVNSERETRLAESVALELFGSERVRCIPEPTMTTEDVGLFIDRVGGSYYHIGAGCSLPLHNPGFLPDDRAAVTAAALHAALAETWLWENR